MSYKIVRIYFNGGSTGFRKRRTIARGLTEEQAQAHCRDPETSSSTCTRADRKRITKQNGPWFEGLRRGIVLAFAYPDRVICPRTEKPTRSIRMAFKNLRGGDRIRFRVYAGLGRNGPEYTEKVARVQPYLVFETHVVVNMGGKHGLPQVVNDENYIGRA